MRYTSKIMLAMVLLVFAHVVAATTKNSLEYEGALVFTGYNDVAVPGSTGGHFSLKNDLKPEPTEAFRLRYGRYVSDKHWLGVLIAPLTVHSSGKFNRNIQFQDKQFAKSKNIDAVFRFDSYRLLYRYRLETADDFSFSLGGALKVRDAEIHLSDGTNRATKSNVGFVPLLSFNVNWKLADNVDFLIDGEALVAPQGRAEDILFAAQYCLNDNWSLKAGYRILEGGADNDEVYTFSMFHQATLGATWLF